MTLHDQHVHTSYSLDSEASLEQYYQRASELGCAYFVCTDHIEFDSAVNHQDWTVDFEALQTDLLRLYQIYPTVQPLLGVEVGYRKDKLQQMNQVIQKWPFDIVNMSVHDNGNYDYYVASSFETIGIEPLLQYYFENIIDALHHYGDFDVLSHIDFGFKTAYLLQPILKISQYEPYLKLIFAKLIALDKALEVNMKVQRAIGDDNHLRYWLSLYHQMGGTKVTLSSDSHRNEDYLRDFPHYVAIIKQCGFSALCYFIARKCYDYPI